MDHAFEVLGLPEVLARVASYTVSAPGREAVMALRPFTHPAAIRDELGRVEEAGLLARLPRSLSGIPDARTAIRRLRVAGGVLAPVELHSVGALLCSGRELAADLAGADPPLSLLAPLRERLLADPVLEERIARTVSRRGEVLDSAGSQLRRLRFRLRQVRGTIVSRLESYIRSLPDEWVIPDASVTVREGRYVIPVRRAARRGVGGVVHGESATGATLFIEPPLALQLMNRVRELECAETREVERILAACTHALAPLRSSLAESQDALIAFDSLDARARAVRRWKGHVPLVLPRERRALCIRKGRHPLLELRKDVEVVPFDLALEPEERVLVVSGPNTGGKSVFLKAAGLVCVLAQCGIIPPVGKGTRLPVFSGFFADIGDEQSVEHDLSTFAGHLANLKEILAEADERSLVLIDEMGTGTDPREGGALAAAALEALAERKALVVVTSHLGRLRKLDVPGNGIVNGSMHFDPRRAEPTYRFVKGRPGRSYGLAIARALGFPSPLIDTAETRLSRDELRTEALLERLERLEAEADDAAAELAARAVEIERRSAEIDTLRAELDARERAITAQERSARRHARNEARRVLLAARREVEEAIREVRERAGADPDRVARAARRRIESAAQRHRPTPAPTPPDRAPRHFRPGDRVRLAGSGAIAEVVEIRAGRVVVEAQSGMRLEVSAEGLEPASPPLKAPKSRRKGASFFNTEPPPLSPDLRGLRVHEAAARLQQLLDRAVFADLPELRVIHGKGTGALRAKVTELLAEDPRVQEYRAGEIGEGGAGVTIVRLA